MLSILVSLLILKVVTAVDGVVTGALGGILFNFFYSNRGSNYVTERCSRYYSTPY